MLKNKKILILFLLTAFFITTGQKCGETLPANQKVGKPDPITIKYWKVFDDSDNMETLIQKYKALHPYVNIEYTKFTYDEYEEKLLKGLALYNEENQPGPDIFSIQSTWLKKYIDLIGPMPATVTIPYTIEKGSLQKELYTEFRQEKTLSLLEMKNLFPDVVYENQVINNQVYGLPLSIDTLGLFYNPRLLNNVNITRPAKDWVEFQEHVSKLTKLDTTNNQILLAGASIGTAENINRSADILTLLMWQNNVPMTSESGLPTFNQSPPGYARSEIPAAQALGFYTSFADPLSPVYTWNEQMENDLQAFMSGKSAYMFGYAFNIPQIKAQAPKLVFETAQVPQLSETNYNIANYWVESVFKQSKNFDQAWDFIVFITTNEEANLEYLKNSKKPAALVNLLSSQQDDLELAPFANQVLTAKSWYKGKDAKVADEVFKTMITQKLTSELKASDIINFGLSKVNQTY